MLPTLDLLILYKFSLPSSGAAVSSFIYLHSNNIMKTGSGHKKPPSWAMAIVNPSYVYLVLIKIFLPIFGKQYTLF